MGSVASESDWSTVGCSGHETSFSPSIPPLPVRIHYFVSKLILVNFLYRPPSLLPSLSPFWIKQKTNKKNWNQFIFAHSSCRLSVQKGNWLVFAMKKNKRGGRYFLCLIFYGIKLISEGRLQHQVHAYTQKNVRFCLKLFRISFPSEPSLFGVCEFLYYLPPKTNSLSPPLLVSWNNYFALFNLPST